MYDLVTSSLSRIVEVINFSKKGIYSFLQINSNFGLASLIILYIQEREKSISVCTLACKTQCVQGKYETLGMC